MVIFDPLEINDETVKLTGVVLGDQAWTTPYYVLLNNQTDSRYSFDRRLFNGSLRAHEPPFNRMGR